MLIIEDLPDFALNEKQTLFLRHTDYLPLDTIRLRDSIKWKGMVYEQWPYQRYIIDRDIPGKLVRILLQRGLARPGAKVWENQEPFYYDVETLTVPVSRVYVDQFSPTDFYSIPKFFQRFYSPTDIGHKAAHIHDILCDDSVVRFEDWEGNERQAIHPVTASEAATIFLEAQRVALVPTMAARVKYWAVKYGGPRFKASDWDSVEK